ncbi:M17 family peptidase N-terminal domain-containing protein [Flavobacterium hercynium]|uniref:Peptidase M17 n=1 Tax=Flavobacterium hercynium TaxID=387094 RepID=A0A226H8F6_9FLAO|nr:M17 family peptidase N-terminal domain-containing protein [Flavobacterium hercynium]OXA89956.1 peptidase M17 [Flavobacterium hercynium]SMP13915.1 Cytosol aminopeptidase family, N-terminal domain [Flavobacterium hercynium]
MNNLLILKKYKLRTGVLSLLISVLFSGVTGNTALAQTAAIGSTVTWGKVDGVAVNGLVQGPSAAEAELQVACVFEYTEGDIFNPPALPANLNGMVHLDEALKGSITELRKSGKFTGHALETLLITPPKGTLAAKKLLLIGLGDRNSFTPEMMVSVGSVAMREALRLGVSNFSFASDIKDAGIDSPTALVATNVVLGSFEAYRTQTYLKQQKLSDHKPLTKIILLAGPAFYTTAGEGIKTAINKLNAN